MLVEMYTRSPYVGILLRCNGCDREVEVVAQQEEILI